MRKVRPWNPKWLGTLCIGLAVGFNRYTVPYLFFFPPPLESSLLLNLVGGIQFIFLLAGLGIWIFRPTLRKPTSGEALLFFGSIFLTVFLGEIAAQFWLRHFATKE